MELNLDELQEALNENLSKNDSFQDNMDNMPKIESWVTIDNKNYFFSFKKIK